MSSLPRPRGPITERLFEALRKPPHTVEPVSDAIEDEDLHLALYCCYELHYRGFEGVDERWEWEPSLLAPARDARAQFEEELLELVGAPGAPPEPSGDRRSRCAR